MSATQASGSGVKPTGNRPREPSHAERVQRSCWVDDTSTTVPEPSAAPGFGPRAKGTRTPRPFRVFCVRGAARDVGFFGVRQDAQHRRRGVAQHVAPGCICLRGAQRVDRFVGRTGGQRPSKASVGLLVRAGGGPADRSETTPRSSGQPLCEGLSSAAAEHPGQGRRSLRRRPPPEHVRARRLRRRRARGAARTARRLGLGARRGRGRRRAPGDGPLLHGERRDREAPRHGRRPGRGLREPLRGRALPRRAASKKRPPPRVMR